jgi:methionyl-tRNA formyltransferase
MRILFMGTGEIALPSFRMVAEGGELVGLVTQPDRPVGRSSKPRPPRIKELALEAEVPVVQPERVRRKSAVAEIAALEPDLIVVMAYGQILSNALLEMPGLGCINVHASLLPRHRGASCIQAAIGEGDVDSGVTIMHLAEGLDTGDIILAQATTLTPEETGGSLHDRLAESSPEPLKEAIELIASGHARRVPQDEGLATYAPKLERKDGEIDWSMPARQLERRIRAYHPWPGTFTTMRDERGRAKRLKVFPRTVVAGGAGSPGEVLAVESDAIVIGCGEGALQLREVQAEGSRRLAVSEFLKGQKIPVGNRFFSLEQGDE